MTLPKYLLTILLACSISLLWAQHHEPNQEHSPTESQTSESDHAEEEYDGPGGEETVADRADEEGGFNANEVILDHILDSHDWHITDIPTGEKDAHGHPTYNPVAIHLPWLFFHNGSLKFFANTHALHESGQYLAYDRGLYAVKSGAPVAETFGGHGHGHHKLSEAEWEAFKTEWVDEDATVLDFSLTKTVVQMIIIMLLVLLVFTSVARAYTRRPNEAPKGLQSFMEPVIIFVRDECARPYLHEKADKFLPYLLTLFFFIWFANLFGLLPFNSNITGNISVTAALALLTFILTQVNGSKDHWKHIFNTPGVPVALKFVIPLMPVVEFIGLFTKPFALAVRLFANITAGHFMILGLISLIFIMGANGTNLAAGMTIAPLSILFGIVIFCLEMIVALVQPFIFTLLTAVFIGMAMETHDDHH